MFSSKIIYEITRKLLHTTQLNLVTTEAAEHTRVKFAAGTDMTIYVTLFWDMASYSTVNRYKFLVGTYFLHRLNKSIYLHSRVQQQLQYLEMSLLQEYYSFPYFGKVQISCIKQA
jgi:hypothetical protein